MKLRSLLLTLGLVAGCVAFGTPAMAQYYNEDTQANPLADFQNSNDDPFSGGGDSASGMMNLMHRMMRGEPTDAATFMEEQRDNMNDVMSNFRTKQMELLKQRQLQANPTTPAPKTSSVLKPKALQRAFQTSTLMLTPMPSNALVLLPTE